MFVKEYSDRKKKTKQKKQQQQPKTNLSTTSYLSNKLSSPLETPKSLITTSKLTATPKLLNSEALVRSYSSSFTIKMEDLIATMISQDEKIQSLTK